MPNEKGRAVRGTAKAQALTEPHSKGWDLALERAVAGARRFGQGSHNVNVEFSAVVSVTNPGQIESYVVTLTKT